MKSSSSIGYARTMLARNADLRPSERGAKRAYRNIMLNCGRPPLDAAVKRQVRDYCGDVLGSTAYTTSMEVYALFQGRFREGWITDDYFRLQVIHNSIPSHIHAQRTLNVALFGRDGMPEVAYLINGHWFTPGMDRVPESEKLDLVFAECEEVYIKIEGSARGEGTVRTDRAGFDAALARIIPGLRRNAVVQRHVKPHKWFRAFNESSVAPIRINTTFTDANGPTYRSGLMPFSRKNERVMHPPSAIKAGILGRSGDLTDEACGPNWRMFTAHPDSGKVFKGATIPNFAKVAAFCERLHGHLPHYQIIGWDVTFTDAGEVMLLEWNGGHCGFNVPETLTGPEFRDCNFERYARPLMPPRRMLRRQG